MGCALRIVLAQVCLLTCALAGCVLLDNPLLDIPLLPEGTTRSPPFRVPANTTYQIVIGLLPMRVDEATCAAAFPRGLPPGNSCSEVRPPFGPASWTVMQEGVVVARGDLKAEPVDLPRGRPNSWAKDPAMTWATHTGWRGSGGKTYVIELRLQKGAVDLTPYQPRMAIIEPL
jgi:hypothetical protein